MYNGIIIAEIILDLFVQIGIDESNVKEGYATLFPLILIFCTKLDNPF